MVLEVSLGRISVEEITSVFVQVIPLLFLAWGVEEGEQVQKAGISGVMCKAGCGVCTCNLRSREAEAGRT